MKKALKIYGIIWLIDCILVRLGVYYGYAFDEEQPLSMIEANAETGHQAIEGFMRCWKALLSIFKKK